MVNPRNSSSSRSLPSECKIITSRLFDAALALVWSAWSTPEMLVQWWGPDGFTITIDRMDFCTGGEWIFTMHGPDGRHYPNHKIFSEIKYAERIVMRHIGLPKHTMTITFKPEGAGTRLTMLHVFDSRSDFDFAVTGNGAVAGAVQHLANLAAFLQATG